MRIVRQPKDASGWKFFVYRATDAHREYVEHMVRNLEEDKLPFTIGGVVGDESRLLTVGPLSDDQAVSFWGQWGHFIVSVSTSN